jgi:hypothetical protein
MNLVVLFEHKTLKPHARIVVTVRTPEGKTTKVTYKVRAKRQPKRF